MWEAAAFGPAHSDIERSVGPGVQVTLAVLRESPKGRRVVVTARGERRGRRLAIAKLLPTLAPDIDESPAGATLDRIIGHLPPPGVDAADLWARLMRFEADWLHPSGTLLVAGVREGHLAVKGLIEAGFSEAAVGQRARFAGARLGLFAGGTVSAAFRPFPLASGDTEPAWQLKPTEIEAARTALALGYYENPRRCTMEDIAKVLGITKSAVYHRIHGLEQKAVRRIVHQHGQTDERDHVERGLMPASGTGLGAWAPPQR
jgi:DNA binding protein with HTH domain